MFGNVMGCDEMGSGMRCWCSVGGVRGEKKQREGYWGSTYLDTELERACIKV